MYMQFEEAGLINMPALKPMIVGAPRCSENWTDGLIKAGILEVGQDNLLHVAGQKNSTPSRQAVCAM